MAEGKMGSASGVGVYLEYFHQVDTRLSLARVLS